jgi:chromosome segregation ATPase
MHEKIRLVILGFICIGFFLITGCRSVGYYTDNSVLEHQARIIELENRNRDLTERLGQYDKLVERTVERLEAIRERASSIRDAADRIDYLFTEYERAVHQLIYELRSSSGEIGKGTEEYKDIIYYLALLDGSESFEAYSRIYLAGNQ